MSRKWLILITELVLILGLVLVVCMLPGASWFR